MSHSPKTYLLTHAQSEDSNQPAHPQFNQSLLCRNFASLAIQSVPSEDSDQTARMRSLI